MAETLKSTLIVGCGDLGRRVASRLRAAGDETTGTTRRPERTAELREVVDRAVVLDVTGDVAGPLGTARFHRVVYCVAAGRGGDGHAVYAEGPRRVLDALSGRPPERFVLVSSTGVWAQRGGEDIDETTPALSDDGNSRWIRAGEAALRDAARITDVVVVRLGGLYGPSRSPVEWIRAPSFRERLSSSGLAWMNWVHVDDAADAIAAAATRGVPGAVYTVVDGHPVRRRDLWTRAAELAGVEPPALPEDPADLGKRCSNAKARRELGFEPRHPDVLEGLAAT